MILQIGEKIHVIHRQLFEGDVRRHFVGTVLACDESSALVKGYLFAMDTKLNEFVKQESLRTRVIPVASGLIIVNLLPPSVDIEKITYQYRQGGMTIVTDGSDWRLDLSHL